MEKGKETEKEEGSKPWFCITPLGLQKMKM